jgi:hypothetical protein
MPLPALPDASFSHRCPHCGTARVNTGQWFRAISGYKCEGCGNAVRVTYEDKVKLFARPETQPGAGAQTRARRRRPPPLGEVLELREQGRSWKEVAHIINERHAEDWHGESLMEGVARLQRRARTVTIVAQDQRELTSGAACRLSMGGGRSAGGHAPLSNRSAERT